MKIIIVIATVFAFGYWFLMMMASPMLVSAPSSGPTGMRTLLILSAIFFVPVGIGAIYCFAGWTFLGLSPRVFLILCALASVIFPSVLGYPRFFMLALQGIPSQGLYISEKGVYLDGVLIPDADGKTFEQLGSQFSGFYRDKNHVYRYEKVILGADPRTFHNPNREDTPYMVYWMDQKHVYARGVLVPEAQAASFMPMGNGEYGKDSKQVFFRGKVVAGADPATFEVTGDGTDESRATDAKDKNRTYLRGNPL